MSMLTNKILTNSVRSSVKQLVNYLNIVSYSQQYTTDFYSDFEAHHCPVNAFQKTVLAAGSAAISILNPYRGDMIACLGEVTGESALNYMKTTMEQSNEGRQILEEKPRINTSTVDMQYLETLPEDSLGNVYVRFLQKHKITPDERVIVQFIDDKELAYVMQRYREVHDLIHTVLQMPTNMLGEVTVKWVEALQFKLPMCISGAIFGPLRLKPKHRQLYLKSYLPWALKTGKNAEFLLNIYFERRWEQKIDDFYREFNIEPLQLAKK